MCHNIVHVQVHMYMEPQTAVAKWDEGGVIQVTSSTQSADHVQWAVSAALGLPNNRVNVHCRRAGGGFGGKFSRSRPAATAVAVAAYKLRRQVCCLQVFKCLLPGSIGLS